MRNVNFISAGAGSGKTYSIVGRIVENILSGECHADEIILTTFTVAAADELKEKVRKALYENGLFQEALRLENAAIGTIHSISFQFVTRYWYLLGLSADIRLIADEAVDFYISQSISGLPEKEDVNLFNTLINEFAIMQKGNKGQSVNIPDRHFWKDDLRSIIDKIENFGISVADLSKSEAESLQILNGLLSSSPYMSAPLTSWKTVVEAVESAIRKYVELMKGENGKSKNLKDALEDFKRTIRDDKAPLRAYGSLVKKVLVGLNSAKALKACAEELTFLQNVPDAVLRSDQTNELVERYVQTIFRLAAIWKEEYEEFKKRRRILDFNDTQRLFDRLLDREEVVEELRGRYKLIFVDEFQDSSPQQISFFTKLSRILRRSVWVGDIKQAIYGFRGTDTSIVKSVIERISKGGEGNSLSTLDYSWRSNSAIVELVNDVFVRVFSALPPDLVKLQMPDKSARYDRPAERGLLHLHINGKNKVEIYDVFAREIENLHKKEGLEYREMAVLCRDRYDMSDFIDAFKKAGIPYKKATDSKENESSDALNMLNAILSVAASDYNDFSKGLLLYYSEPGQTASHIVSERLRFLADKDGATDPLAASEVVVRIKKLRQTIGNQSISNAVETLLIELDAIDLIRRLDPSLPAYRIVAKYVECARSYEEICQELSLGCSLAGFIDWMRQKDMEEIGDEDGITISTYHKAKGLEWRCVLLGSLHRHPIDRNKVFFGVNVLKETGKMPLIFLAPKFLSAIATPAFVDEIDKCPAYRKLQDDVLEESKRLLYVGMTRPREVLVTFTSKNNATTWPDVVTGVEMNALNRKEKEFEWLGHRFENRVVAYESSAEADALHSSGTKVRILKCAVAECEYPLRDIAPSGASPLKTLERVDLAADFAPRLNASAANGDDALLGNCIHQLLCAYRDKQDFLSVVRDSAIGYGVTLNPEEFIIQTRKMYDWLRSEYGEPVSVEREIPFRYRLPNGQQINGEIDMIYRTPAGDVLIDYKTCMRPAREVVEETGSKFYAGKYSGQLAFYEEAIRLAGRELRDSVIIYFNLGIAVRMIK